MTSRCASDRPARLSLLALLAAAGLAAACGGGTSPPAPPVGPLGASCADCIRSTQGAPRWEPVAAALFREPDWDGAGAAPVLSSILAPDHRYYETEGIFGPALAHPGPYAGELGALFAAAGVVPTQNFATTDLAAPAWATLVLEIVPSADAPTGSSFDAAAGPIVPNDRFPIRTAAAFYRDGSRAGTALAPDVPGYDRFSPPIAADGPGHFFVAMPWALEWPVREAAYGYRVAIADSAGEGWTVEIPFTVGLPRRPDAGTGPDAGSGTLCTGAAPPRALITDFSDATAATARGTGIAFGRAPNVTGHAYASGTADLAVPVLSLASRAPADGGAPTNVLDVAIDSGPASGSLPTGPFSSGVAFGLAFDRCVDATAYAGVRFTVDGDLGNCPPHLAVTFSQDDPVARNPALDSCTAASCMAPGTNLTRGSEPLLFAFDDLFFGRPVAALDRARITGVELQMQPDDGAACTAHYAIRNVSFVTDVPPRNDCDSPPLSPVLIGAGVTPGPLGAQFTFSAPGLTAPTVYQVAEPSGDSPVALEVNADPGIAADPGNAEIGFGYYLCTDASAYTGIKLTVTGDLGSCTLRLSADPTQDVPPHFNIGTCTVPGCRPPLSPPLPLGTSVVRFADMTGGVPLDSVDPTSIGALQWTIGVPTDPTAPPCQAAFRIEDVSFVSE